jgi:hypothetical protein
MRKLPLLAILSATIFTSCQKVLEITGQLKDTKSVILDKITFTSDSIGTSSGSTSYTYDSKKRLIVQNSIFLYNGQLVTNSYIGYDRDNLGRIAREIHSDIFLAQQPGPDSTYTYFYYQSPTSNVITYTRQYITYPGFLDQDSTVYTYDASGRLASTARYTSPDGNFDTTTYFSFSYEYDATGNMTSQIGRNYEQDVVVNQSQIEYQYDNKVEPLYASVNDAFRYLYTKGPHNVIQTTITSSYGTTVSPTTSYIYRPDGRPVAITDGEATTNYLYK